MSCRERGSVDSSCEDAVDRACHVEQRFPVRQRRVSELVFDLRTCGLLRGLSSRAHRIPKIRTNHTAGSACPRGTVGRDFAPLPDRNATRALPISGSAGSSGSACAASSFQVFFVFCGLGGPRSTRLESAARDRAVRAPHVAPRLDLRPRLAFRRPAWSSLPGPRAWGSGSFECSEGCSSAARADTLSECGPCGVGWCASDGPPVPGIEPPCEARSHFARTREAQLPHRGSQRPPVVVGPEPGSSHLPGGRRSPPWQQGQRCSRGCLGATENLLTPVGCQLCWPLWI